MADIVIRTWAKDAAWLRACVAAVDRYCSGWRDLIIVAPESSMEALRRCKLPIGRLVACENSPADYLGQQVTKLYADLITDADLICHLDSDCIIRRPLRPGDLLDDAGRAVIVRTPATCFQRNRAPWQGVTEQFLCRPVTFDYMRRHPIVYPRWLYAELREFCRQVHGVELDSYVLSQSPAAFSEFNSFGAFADERHHDSFAWVERHDTTFDESFARVFWSWAGIGVSQRVEIDSILHEGGM